MPHRDGSEVLQDLRADPATRDVPVVIVSTLPAQLMETYELRGATAVVAKDELTPERIRGLLQQAGIPQATEPMAKPR